MVRFVDLKLDQLKKELGVRNLSSQGTKAELQKRLREFLERSGENVDEMEFYVIREEEQARTSDQNINLNTLLLVIQQTSERNQESMCELSRTLESAIQQMTERFNSKIDKSVSLMKQLTSKLENESEDKGELARKGKLDESANEDELGDSEDKGKLSESEDKGKLGKSGNKSKLGESEDKMVLRDENYDKEAEVKVDTNRLLRDKVNLEDYADCVACKKYFKNRVDWMNQESKNHRENIERLKVEIQADEDKRKASYEGELNTKNAEKTEDYTVASEIIGENEIEVNSSVKKHSGKSKKKKKWIKHLKLRECLLQKTLSSGNDKELKELTKSKKKVYRKKERVYNRNVRSKREGRRSKFRLEKTGKVTVEESISSFSEGELILLYMILRKAGKSLKLRPSYEGHDRAISRVNDEMYRVLAASCNKVKMKGVHLRLFAEDAVLPFGNERDSSCGSQNRIINGVNDDKYRVHAAKYKVALISHDRGDHD